MASDEKKKSMAALIVAKMRPSAEHESEESDKTEKLEEEDGKTQAAREMMDAIESRDAKALAEALASFNEMCRS